MTDLITFAWPAVLFALLLVPVLAAGYLLVQRGRRRRAVPYSSVALIRAARPTRTGWRRHLPAGLVLAALACLTVAGARPQLRAELPVSASTVIIALDVSGSMCATDVEPNRLTAAQAAVRDFINAQDAGTQLGLVVFSGFAQVAVAPTTDRGDLLQAVDSLTTGRGTTIGAAILKSVDAISQINPDVAPAGVAEPEADGAAAVPAPPAPGTVPYAPEIVVLLTDGANTRGIKPRDAAAVAAARGVRVYPIGFGTTEPTTLVCSPDQLGGNTFDSFSGGRFVADPRRRAFLVADEATLKQVATTTGGAYFKASDSDQLQNVLADLPRHVQVQQREVEVSVALAGLAALLVLLSVWAAARWTAFPT
jgi:Ca-activated chloride channel homolog